MDYAKLRKNAEETLADLDALDPDRMDAKQFMLYGAATAILGHERPEAVSAKLARPVDGGHENAENDADYYAGKACGELKGAEEYWQLYNETGEDVYRQMAKQELSHASVFIQKLEKLDPQAAQDYRAKLQNLERAIR